MNENNVRESLDQTLYFALLRRRQMLLSAKHLSYSTYIPTITAVQKLNYNDKFSNMDTELYNFMNNKEENKMAVVKFYEKVVHDDYIVRYTKDDGVFTGMPPKICKYDSFMWREIQLDNPPTDYFPVRGSVDFGTPFSSPFIGNNSQPSVTLHGAAYCINKVEYCIDEGGAQKIYLEKKVFDDEASSRKYYNALLEYDKVMKEFMKQLMDTDFRFKQFVKTHYGSVKKMSAIDILETIATILEILVDDDELDSTHDIDITNGTIDDEGKCDYINALYERIIHLEIDDNLRLIDTRRATTSICELYERYVRGESCYDKYLITRSLPNSVNEDNNSDDEDDDDDED